MKNARTTQDTNVAAPAPRILEIAKDRYFETVQLSGNTMCGITATNAKSQFSSLLDQAQGEPVVIVKGSRASAVMVSAAYFVSMVNAMKDLGLRIGLEAEAEGCIGADAVASLREQIDAAPINDP